jgi:hypothetical protein
MIGLSDEYPSVAWMNFVNYTHQWKIVDKNLTQADIDRIFIATNFEEVDLEDNDDRNLCRYEYYEIIARMAKVKFQEKGICDCMHSAVEKFCLEYLIPNTIDVMKV